MLDDLFELFERDGRRDRPGDCRGTRGLLGRLFSDGDEESPDRDRRRPPGRRRDESGFELD